MFLPEPELDIIVGTTLVKEPRSRGSTRRGAALGFTSAIAARGAFILKSYSISTALTISPASTGMPRHLLAILLPLRRRHALLVARVTGEILASGGCARKRVARLSSGRATVATWYLLPLRYRVDRRPIRRDPECWPPPLPRRSERSSRACLQLRRRDR